jgi:hypothetical protein
MKCPPFIKSIQDKGRSLFDNGSQQRQINYEILLKDVGIAPNIDNYLASADKTDDDRWILNLRQLGIIFNRYNGLWG